MLYHHYHIRMMTLMSMMIAMIYMMMMMMMMMMMIMVTKMMNDKRSARGKRRDCSRVIAADRLPRCISDSPL